MWFITNRSLLVASLLCCLFAVDANGQVRDQPLEVSQALGGI